MTATSTNVPRRQIQAAENRREWHEHQVSRARNWRDRMWRAAAWLVAEVRHLGEAERGQWADEILGLADRLNARNGGRA